MSKQSALWSSNANLEHFSTPRDRTGKSKLTSTTPGTRSVGPVKGLGAPKFVPPKAPTFLVFNDEDEKIQSGEKDEQKQREEDDWDGPIEKFGLADDLRDLSDVEPLVRKEFEDVVLTEPDLTG